MEGSITSILEDEIKIAENKILEKTGGSSVINIDKEDISEEVNKIDIAKSKKKDDIIDDILEVEGKLGITLSNRDKLTRKTKPTLLKMLAELINKQSGGLVEPSDPGSDHFFENKKQDEVQQPISQYDVKTLNNLNILVVTILEKVSDLGKKYTLDTPILQGWTKEIQKQDQELNRVFAEILRKYGGSISKYLNPIAEYGIIMGSSAGMIAATNIQKKREISQKD